MFGTNIETNIRTDISLLIKREQGYLQAAKYLGLAVDWLGLPVVPHTHTHTQTGQPVVIGTIQWLRAIDAEMPRYDGTPHIAQPDQLTAFLNAWGEPLNFISWVPHTGMLRIPQHIFAMYIYEQHPLTISVTEGCDNIFFVHKLWIKISDCSLSESLFLIIPSTKHVSNLVLMHLWLLAWWCPLVQSCEMSILLHRAKSLN